MYQKKGVKNMIMDYLNAIFGTSVVKASIRVRTKSLVLINETITDLVRKALTRYSKEAEPISLISPDNQVLGFLNAGIILHNISLPKEVERMWISRTKKINREVQERASAGAKKRISTEDMTAFAKNICGYHGFIAMIIGNVLLATKRKTANEIMVGQLLNIVTGKNGRKSKGGARHKRSTHRKTHKRSH